MKNHFVYPILILASILLLSACNKNICADSVKAELKNLTSLDGCGYVLELENGTKLEPLNLANFITDLEDGKKVWVTYHLSTSLIATTCMVGDIIEIDCIIER